MVTGIALINLTQEGIDNIENSPARIDAARELNEELGGALTDFYFAATGEYDMVAIGEFPDIETATKVRLLSDQSEAIEIRQTIVTHPEDEYRRIIDELS